MVYEENFQTTSYGCIFSLLSLKELSLGLKVKINSLQSKGGMIMTANQVSYWRNQEEQRSHKAQEAENIRSHKADEAERLRHNKRDEDVKIADIAEKYRHNVRAENQNSNEMFLDFIGKSLDRAQRRSDSYRKTAMDLLPMLSIG